jgi:hypothetical protein
MKIIFDKTSTSTPFDDLTSLTVDSENANFPKENLRDDYTTNVWRAATGVKTATITAYVSKGSAVEVLNTNATSATVKAVFGEDYAFEADWDFEADWEFASSVISASTMVYSLPGLGGRLWADYAEAEIAHTVTIELTADDDVYAGILRVGMVETFPEPTFGLGESSIDYSVERELNIGSAYYRKRNVVRQFNGVSIIDTRANIWALKHDIFDAVGPQPLAIRIISSTAITDWEFVVYAKCLESPRIDHITNDYSRLSFTLQEVI